MPIDLPPSLLDAYAQRKASLPADVIGLMLIGSRALGQSVGASDYDTRLVVHSNEPFVRYDDPVWTKALDVPAAVLGWADLNPDLADRVSFGLTNLRFVQRCVERGYFPLNDHTALFQGTIAIDETGAVAAFREAHRGVAYANIVPDYLAQSGWRVTQRLSHELAAMRLGEGLDLGKQAVPALHTCCRIVQEIAQIATYRQRNVYLEGLAAIADYYATRWPDFNSAFQALFQYKTDEARRWTVFEGIQAHDPECLAVAEALAQQTVALWHRFITPGTPDGDNAQNYR